MLGTKLSVLRPDFGFGEVMTADIGGNAAAVRNANQEPVCRVHGVVLPSRNGWGIPVREPKQKIGRCRM